MRLSKLLNMFYANYYSRMKSQLLCQAAGFIGGLLKFLNEPSVKQLVLCWVKCVLLCCASSYIDQAGDIDIYLWLVNQGLLEACFQGIRNQIDTSTSLDKKSTSTANRNIFTVDAQNLGDLLEIIVSFVTLESFYSDLNQGQVCDVVPVTHYS